MTEPAGKTAESSERKTVQRKGDGLALQDLLTVARLVSVPVLWALALLGRGPALGVGLALAGTTDVLDGMIARHRGASTSWGSRLDTIADLAVLGSVLVWFWLFAPEFYREQALPLAVWVGIGGVALVVGYLRFGRWGDLHLWSTKAAAFLSYVFSIHLFVFGGYDERLFAVAITVSIVSTVEALVAQLTRESVEDRRPTVLYRR